MDDPEDDGEMIGMTRNEVKKYSAVDEINNGCISSHLIKEEMVSSEHLQDTFKEEMVSSGHLQDTFKEEMVSSSTFKEEIVCSGTFKTPSRRRW